MRRSINIAVIYLSIISLLFSQTTPAHAALISTEQSMIEQRIDVDRKALQDVLNRDVARTLLEDHGITHEQAQERINAMTDQEVQMFSQKFEELSAGGSIGIVAAVLILILLFIALELSGKTDVFNGM